MNEKIYIYSEKKLNIFFEELLVFLNYSEIKTLYTVLKTTEACIKDKPSLLVVYYNFNSANSLNLVKALRHISLVDICGNLPILVVAPHINNEICAQFKDAGANLLISEPFDAKKLKQVIDKLMHTPFENETSEWGLKPKPLFNYIVKEKELSIPQTHETWLV